MNTREMLIKFSSVDGNSGDEKLAAKAADKVEDAADKVTDKFTGSMHM